MKQSHVKLINGFVYQEGDGETICIGILDTVTLPEIKVGEYQREKLSITVKELVEDLKDGAKFPVIELGMRGSRYVQDGGSIVLEDDTYVIDGLQRITAEIIVLKEFSDKKIYQLAKVHFNSTEAMERDLFEVLNINRSKLSPNVILRNWRHKYPAIEVLVELCTQNSEFALYNRVCWQQSNGKNDLIS